MLDTILLALMLAFFISVLLEKRRMRDRLALQEKVIAALAGCVNASMKTGKPVTSRDVRKAFENRMPPGVALEAAVDALGEPQDKNPEATMARLMMEAMKAAQQKEAVHEPAGGK